MEIGGINDQIRERPGYLLGSRVIFRDYVIYSQIDYCTNEYKCKEESGMHLVTWIWEEFCWKCITAACFHLFIYYSLCNITNNIE